MNHITIIDRRGSRRIMGAPGVRHNLCGGALTDRDMTWQDAKRCHKMGELDKWLTCPECRALLLKSINKGA